MKFEAKNPYKNLYYAEYIKDGIPYLMFYKKGYGGKCVKTLVKSKYLLEVSIGRKLKKDEKVGFKDCNRRNVAIDNIYLVAPIKQKCLVCRYQFKNYEVKNWCSLVCMLKYRKPLKDDGTLNPYAKHNGSGSLYCRKNGCRCVKCTEANRLKHYRASVKRHAMKIKPEHVHGTYNGYVNYGCRCDKCRACNTERCRQAYYKRKGIVK